jgi:PAS domain S-box-containing protein
MKAQGKAQRPAGWWANRSIRTKGLVVLAVPIAILLAVLGSTSWFTHVNDRAQSLSQRGRAALTLSNQLNSDILDANNGVRGYLLTSDSSYLSNYEGAKASTPGALDEIASVTNSIPQEARAFVGVRDDAERTLGDLSSLVGQPPTVPSDVTKALLAKTETDLQRFEVSVAHLKKVLNTNLNKYRNTVHLSYDDVLIITAVGAALGVTGGIALSYLFTSGVTRRIRRLEKATAAVENGELPIDAPGGSDEIGRLSSRLITSTSQLRERVDERDKARRQLEDILTASPVVSLVYDVASERFSYASPNLNRLLGISAEEAMSDAACVTDRFHPRDAEHLRDVLVDAVNRHDATLTDGTGDAQAPQPSAERVEIVLRFRRDLSYEAWGEAEGIYTLEYDTDGKLAAVVAYLVDASERHAAQRAADERRSTLETIFHASPDTIVVRDVVGRIILASSTLADVIGVGQRSVDRSGEYAGSSEKIASVTLEDRALLDALAARCLAGEPTPDPVLTTSRFPGGDFRTFETRARAVLDPMGHVIGTVTVSRDVTDRIRLERSLRETSAEAGRASEAKSEFLSRMSHELRTPLNAILGFAQLMELDDLSEDQASSVDQIQRAGRHLLSLINEVLDISRIEAGRLSLSAEPIEVGDVLDEVASLLSPAAESADLQLSVDSDGARDIYVRADRQRLLQVLLNLGSNALKYNDRGGSVAFRTSAQKSGRVRFEVRDTGPGIPREQQAELFVPFSRLGAERSGVEGTGVGLALSKQLAELMGGSIGVESVPGHGSTFWVELLAAHAPGRSSTFPIYEDPPGAAAQTSMLTGAGRLTAELPERPAQPTEPPFGAAREQMETQGARPGMDPHVFEPGAGVYASDAPGASRDLNGGATNGGEGTGGEVVVLQIEDNESNASLVEQVLSRRSHVRLVSSTEATLGLELARTHRPDLILLDLHLPDMSGEEVLHRLKASPELMSTKVVVVSADATPSRIRRMLELGVEGYLTKPVDVEALLRLVDLEIAATRGAV